MAAMPGMEDWQQPCNISFGEPVHEVHEVLHIVHEVLHIVGRSKYILTKVQSGKRGAFL